MNNLDMRRYEMLVRVRVFGAATSTSSHPQASAERHSATLAMNPN
jgi:hypothetical protein